MRPASGLRSRGQGLNRRSGADRLLLRMHAMPECRKKNPYQGCIVAEDVTPSSRSLLAASLACVPAPAPLYRVPRRVRASTSIGGHACTLGLSGWFHCDGGNFFLTRSNVCSGSSGPSPSHCLTLWTQHGEPLGPNPGPPASLAEHARGRGGLRALGVIRAAPGAHPGPGNYI